MKTQRLPLAGALALAAGTGVSVSWLADASAEGIKEATKGLLGDPWATLVGVGLSLTLFVLCTSVAYRLRRRWLRMRAPVVSGSTDQRRCLIMGLSRLGKNLPSEDGYRQHAEAEVTQILRTFSFDIYASTHAEAKKNGCDEATNERLTTNWQQNIRAIKKHLQTISNSPLLEEIIVIPSRTENDDVGSSVQSDNFADLVHGMVRQVRPNSPLNIKIMMARSYDSFDDVYHGMNEAIKYAYDRGYADRDICIDATAGTKPFSIAAAMATTNRALIFSYVRNKGEVVAFDAEMQAMSWMGE